MQRFIILKLGVAFSQKNPRPFLLQPVFLQGCQALGDIDPSENSKDHFRRRFEAQLQSDARSLRATTKCTQQRWIIYEQHRSTPGSLIDYPQCKEETAKKQPSNTTAARRLLKNTDIACSLLVLEHSRNPEPSHHVRLQSAAPAPRLWCT